MWSFTNLVQSKHLLIGTFVGLDSVLAHQIIGASGYDCVIVDMEHTPLSAREATTAVHAVAAASKGTCTPLVRVPSHGLEWIKWGLDSGAAGVVVPMVESAQQARDIIERSRYPPLGSRSFGPLMAAFAHPDSDRSQTGYLAAAKDLDSVAVIPMIESAKGVQDAEAILATQGISGAFVGPFDLRLSLGLAGGDGDEDVFVKALESIAAAGKKAGKPVGIYAGTAETMRKYIEMGFRFFLWQGDTAMLAATAKTSVEDARSVFRAA